MEVIIELDGTRHKLVEGPQERRCEGCSIYDVCSKTLCHFCDFPGYDMAMSSYEKLK